MKSTVYVYEMTTNRNSATEASVDAVALSVLDVRPVANHYRWTVAVTEEQALKLHGLAWVINPMQRGQMYQIDENLEFYDHEREETWLLPIESLAR